MIVTGYLHIMDTDSARHTTKRHGNQEEVLRGQVPLVREDFLLLPNVFVDCTPEVRQKVKVVYSEKETTDHEPQTTHFYQRV